MNKKVFLGNFLALVLIVGLCPLTSFAATETIVSSGRASSLSVSVANAVNERVESVRSYSSSVSSSVSSNTSSSVSNSVTNGSSNLVLNSSFEQAGDLDKASDWNDFGDGYTRITSVHRSGSASIMINRNDDTGNSGAWQRVNLSQTEMKPVFIGAYVKGSNINMKSGSWFGASIYVEIHLTNGNVVYWNSVPSFGTFDWRWIGFNTGTLSGVNAPIDYIFVVPVLGAASGTAYFDDIFVKEFNPTQGAITIMFDDGETSTITEGKKKLDSAGFKGSVSVITSKIGTAGFMNRSQLLTLQRAGWEIVSHSVSHEDLTLMTPANYNRELSLSKSQLTSMGLKVNSFALPYGAYNADIMANAAKYYSSARAYEIGDNPQGVYPFEVKVRGLVNSTPISEVQNWIDKAKNEKRWEILVFHTIAESGDDGYYSTPKQLSDIVDLIKASGLPVVTYDQGLKMFAVTPAS